MKYEQIIEFCTPWHLFICTSDIAMFLNHMSKYYYTISIEYNLFILLYL